MFLMNNHTFLHLWCESHFLNWMYELYSVFTSQFSLLCCCFSRKYFIIFRLRWVIYECCDQLWRHSYRYLLEDSQALISPLLVSPGGSLYATTSFPCCHHQQCKTILHGPSLPVLNSHHYLGDGLLLEIRNCSPCPNPIFILKGEVLKGKEAVTMLRWPWYCDT